MKNPGHTSCRLESSPTGSPRGPHSENSSLLPRPSHLPEEEQQLLSPRGRQPGASTARMEAERRLSVGLRAAVPSLVLGNRRLSSSRHHPHWPPTPGQALPSLPLCCVPYSFSSQPGDPSLLPRVTGCPISLLAYQREEPKTPRVRAAKSRLGSLRTQDRRLSSRKPGGGGWGGVGQEAQKRMARQRLEVR